MLDYFLRSADQIRTYLPVWIDPSQSAKRAGCRQNVDDDEYDGKEHRNQHDAEAWAHSDQTDDAKVVSFLDVIDEIPGCEYPPRVALQR